MDAAMRSIPLATPNIGAAEEERVLKALRDGWVSTVGPDVAAFEEGVAAVAGTPTASATASGTAALMLALRALGVGPGDTVLCPTYTFIATANAISAAGARPAFVDVDPATWSIDPEASVATAERIAERYGKPPAAVVVVYPMGNPVDLAPLRAVCERFGMALVADAAAALGATWEGRAIGLLADATSYSFNGNKTITTGGGGAVVGPPELVARVKHLATTGRVGRDYDHDVPAFNERMTNLEAALGCAQLARLDAFIAAKARIADAVGALADELGCARAPRDARAARGDWFPALVLGAGDPPIRDVIASLNGEGIGVRLFWKPMHQQEAYAGDNAAGDPQARFPVADGLWERVLVLPSSTHLSDADLARTLDATRRAITKGRASRTR